MKSPAGTSEISTTGGEHGFLNTLGKATLSSRPTSGKVSHAALLSESISHQQNEACEKNQPLPVLVLCPCDKKSHRRSVLRKGLLVLVWCFWLGEEVGGGHRDGDGEAGSRTRDAQVTWLASFPPTQSGCSVYGTVKPAFKLGLSQDPLT